MRLIFSLFALPFWVFLAAAGGLFYLAELSHRDTLAQNEEMARALAGPPPDTVSLAEFSRQNDIGLADEVSVQGVINPAYNYELTKKRKGRDTTRFMFVLFDASDPEESKVARGALVLSAAEKDKFVDEYYVENAELGIGAAGFISVVTLNGVAENSSDLTSLVNDAFDEQNLTKSADFIYIEPFLEGREVGLTPTMSADEMRNIIRGFALVVGLIGLAKLALRRRRKPATPAPAEAAFAMDTAPISAGQIKPAGQALAEPEAHAASLEPKPKKTFPIKAVAVIALLAAAIYSGHLAYVAVAALLALQFLAVKKTRHLITGVLTKVTGRGATDNTSEEKIMDKVQDAVRDDVVPQEKAAGGSDPELAPVKPAKRGLSLPFLKRREETEVAPQPDEVQMQPDEATAPKRGFSLPLPGLRRGPKDEITAKTDAVSAKTVPLDDAQTEKPKRGFSLPLPSLRRKSQADDDASTAAPAMVKKPRKKDAFQAEDLFASDETAEAQGISEKVQLFMARMTPAERQPKAFAGRPDPFDRLAAEVERTAAR